MKSIVLPAGTEHVPYGDLAHLIADALWPDAGGSDDRMAYGAARVNLDSELTQAVKAGTLAVKDPLTFGPHTFPIGDALNRALVAVDDLREFVAGRGLSVLFQFTINEDGGSTTFRATQEEYDAMTADKQTQRDERQRLGKYTMHEAAEVLAAAYDIGGAKNFLDKRMRPAAESGALVLLDPIDGGPVTGRLCRLADWVTPGNADKWLEHEGFSHRWPVMAIGALANVLPTKNRRNSVTPVIELAQSKCRNPTDTAEVWSALQVMADEEVPPLLASTNQGLKYIDNGETKYFKRDSLDKRLHPEKRGNPGRPR